MAVAVGSSCAFLTPIGHQSNTLVMAPGGYKFSDYWPMGLPLQILAIVAGTPLIMWWWG
jgi:di/tricarboxylate transporter